MWPATSNQLCVWKHLFKATGVSRAIQPNCYSSLSTALYCNWKKMRNTSITSSVTKSSANRKKNRNNFPCTQRSIIFSSCVSMSNERSKFKWEIFSDLQKVLSLLVCNANFTIIFLIVHNIMSTLQAYKPFVMHSILCMYCALYTLQQISSCSAFRIFIQEGMGLWYGYVQNHGAYFWKSGVELNWHSYFALDDKECNCAFVKLCSANYHALIPYRCKNVKTRGIKGHSYYNYLLTLKTTLTKI